MSIRNNVERNRMEIRAWQIRKREEAFRNRLPDDASQDRKDELARRGICWVCGYEHLGEASCLGRYGEPFAQSFDEMRRNAS